MGLTETRLRPQVAAVLRKYRDARVIGFFAPAPWSGPSSITVEGESVRTIYCASSLAVRDALCEHEERPERLVVLTPRPEDDLGTDVLARLTRRRLFPIESWEAVCSLFQAKVPDPRLTRDRWLAEALIEAAPPEGYDPVPTAVLDADTAWRAFLRHRLGVDPAATDLVGLLRWASSGAAAALLALPADIRLGVRTWLEGAIGPGTDVVLRLVEQGHGSEVVILGLVVRVVTATNVGGVDAVLLRDALVRLEPRLGGHLLRPEEGRAWASAAEHLLRTMGAVEAAQAQEHAAQILRELRIDNLAHQSDILLAGGDQRLRQLARTLQAFLERPTQPGAVEVETATRHALAHVQVSRDEARKRVLAMACRIVRRLAESANARKVASLPEAVAQYANDGAFLDRARNALMGGDSLPELNAILGELAAKAQIAREQESRAFASRLADWLVSGLDTDGLFGVEAALDRVVVPVAKLGPVLVVVIDGLDLPTFQNLASDLLRAGWVERGPGERPRPRHALSLVPSVTELSRTSLLSGRVTRGSAADESQGFAGHAGLRAACTAKAPPVLFHKAALGGGATVGLDPAVRAEIDRADRKVVGVVVNAVDDHLTKGDQVRVTWGLDTIGPMRQLIEAAGHAGRTLVILSDHGHVLDRGMEYRKQELAGSRWRSSAAGEPSSDEVSLRGPRVLSADGGPVLALWSERFRYGGKQNGYHGGASPQEMIVPAAVFTPPGAQLAGWDEVRMVIPSWWDGQEVAATIVDVTKVAATPRDGAAAVSRAAEPPKKGQIELPIAPKTVPSAQPTGGCPAWVEALLRSETYKAKREGNSRLAVADERMRELLTVLDARGGTLTQVALARSLNVPPVRLPGMLAAARRLLNVDGFDVLAVDIDSDTVVLNRTLLRTQFGIDE